MKLFSFLLLSFTITQITSGYSQTGTWTTRAPMPTARKEISNATVSLDNKIYVVGGIASNGTISNVLEIYNPVSDTWATGAPLPIAVWRSYASALNGKLYVFGGYTSTSGFPFNPIHRVFEYDPTADSWEEKQHMLTSAGTGVAVAADDKIHILGGATNSALNQHQVFDPNANSWNTSTTLLSSRSGLTATLIDNHIYVYGGYFLSGGVVSQSSVEALDLNTNQWTSVQSMPDQRHGIASAVVGGKAYIFGGLPNATVSRALEYNPGDNSWTEMQDMPTPVSFMGVAAVNDTIFVIGGGAVNLNRFDAVNTNRMFVPPTTPTSVKHSAEKPRTFRISQNYPNPFNPSTTISYSIQTPANVAINIFNLAGQKVRP